MLEQLAPMQPRRLAELDISQHSGVMRSALGFVRGEVFENEGIDELVNEERYAAECLFHGHCLGRAGGNHCVTSFDQDRAIGGKKFVKHALS
jgi:hypothetical protein